NMPGIFGSAPNWPHQSANNTYSILGVIGTLGTADTSGTALTLPVSVDPATGAMFVQDLASSGGTQPVSGTITTNQNSGTFNVGTVVNNGGSVQLSAKPVQNILTFGTAGTSAIGTLVAAPGVGTS